MLIAVIWSENEWEGYTPSERARKTDLERIFRVRFHRRIAEKFVSVCLVRARSLER